MTDDQFQRRASNKVTHENYFPTPISSQDLPHPETLNSHLLEQIYQWRTASPDGIVRSNFSQAGSWHSDLDMHRKPEYHGLTSAVLAMAQAVFDRYQYHNDYQPLIDSMWANINPRHGYNRSHSHPDTLWSGVYYVQTPKNCGRIVFSDPRPQARVITPILDPDASDDINHWSEVSFEPVAGRLILFPGWLVHEVEPNMSALPGPSGDRVSVSFNLIQGRR